MSKFLKPVGTSNPKQGTQVIAIPSHIVEKYGTDGQIEPFVVDLIPEEPRIMRGFVMGETKDPTALFVRYFFPDGTLRTISNSEFTYKRDLWFYEYKPQANINQLIGAIHSRAY